MTLLEAVRSRRERIANLIASRVVGDDQRVVDNQEGYLVRDNSSTESRCAKTGFGKSWGKAWGK